MSMDVGHFVEPMPSRIRKGFRRIGILLGGFVFALGTALGLIAGLSGAEEMLWAIPLAAGAGLLIYGASTAVAWVIEGFMGQPTAVGPPTTFPTVGTLQSPPPVAKPRKLPPVGISGWMILPAIGTFLNPFMWGWAVVEVLSLLKDASPENSALWAWCLGNAGLLALGVVASIYTLRLMLKHRREYPNWFIGLSLAALLYVTAIYGLLAFWGVPITGEEWGEMARAVVQCAVWVPYMLVSARVRNTFVN